MAWRVLEHDGQQWNVSLAAERRPDSSQWNLVLSFRALDQSRSSIWVQYPVSASSKAALFAQADRISDKDLVALLATKLS